MHELLVGPILYRLLLSGPPLDRKLTTSLADAVLDSLSPDGRARSAASRRRGQR